jgi:hypothetical protein
MDTERWGVENGWLFYKGEKPKTVAEAKAISVEKWEIVQEMAEGGRLIADGAYDTCGFCMMFWGDLLLHNHCEGCPIYIETGYRGCHNTPYDRYFQAWRLDMVTEAKLAIKAEIEFLEALDV